MFLFLQTFFASNATPLSLLRHNTMALVKYGFSREEVLWMPVSEMYDYIQLINNQIEEENKAQQNSSREPNETPTLSDVYRGPLSI